MSLSINTCWEVRPTVGSDNNGGGFVAGASGTDWSQQTSPQYALTGIASSGAGATFLTASAAADMVGNIAQVISGTNYTAGFYQILSVVAGVSVTVDRSCCTGVGASGVINIGGSLATITKALTVNTSGNKIFVKKTGTLVITAALTLNNNKVPTTTDPCNQLIGYNSTRGDGGRPIIQGSTSTNWVLVDGNGAQGWLIENFEIDCNSLSLSYGIRINAYTRVRNCKISNFGAYGIIVVNTICSVVDCEITGGLGAAIAAYACTGNSNVLLARNYIHDNACPGCLISIGSQLIWNIIANNTGASSDGIVTNNEQYGIIIFNNVIWGNGRDGIRCSNVYSVLSLNVRNNIIGNNGAYGFTGNTSDGTPAQAYYDGNFYYNNTSGNRRRLDDTGSVNPVNATNPYTNSLDVTLSGDPFTNSGAGDWTLNSTAGAGAAVRAAGTPGPILGTSQVGYLDGGPLQHQDSGGSSGGYGRIVGGGIV